MKKYNGKYSLAKRLLEGQDPKKLATLARALAATSPGDKSRIGDIGEEIADLFMQGINLNDVKDNAQFPFADVASGPITRLKDAALYSVNASGEIFQQENASFAGRDVFVNSSPKGSSIYSLVNERGNLGLRDEIDAQFGKEAKEITLRLGVIGIDMRPNQTTGEPEGLMVRKYGPTKMTFVKDKAGKFRHPLMDVKKWRSRGSIETAFGAVKVLSDPAGGGFEGRDEMIAGVETGRDKVYRQGSIAINPKGLEQRSEKEQAIRDSMARMTDEQIERMIAALNKLSLGQ